MTPAARYLRSFFLTLAALMLAVAAINYVADPYYLFGTTILPADSKPQSAKRPEMAKAAMVARTCPKTLILGNSRTEIGLDPQSPAWPPAAGPIFNASTPGATPPIVRRTLDVALAACKPQTVIFGVDFVDALYPYTKLPPYDWWPRAMDAAYALATLDALGDSLVTLAGRRTADAVTRRDGLAVPEEYRIATLAQGAAYLFALKRRTYLAQMAAAGPFRGDIDSNDMLRLTGEAIDLIARSGAAIVLVTPPYHADFHALLAETGHAGEMEAWKAQLVRLVRQARGRGASIRLLDFATINPITADPIPAERKPARYYWEIGHYNAALGNEMIARIYGPTGFGTELAAP